jgi:hypothetical protein
MAKNAENIDNDTEFETTDQGFAAFLATKFMFMEAVDTGESIGRGKYGTKKAFCFLVPADTDMEQLKLNYQLGTDDTKVPFVVAFNKMRLIRQSCQKPFNAVGGAKHG